MDTSFQLLGIGLALGLLFIGAEGLVRGSSSLARRLGLSPLVIGLTVVAYGTSAPELVVSLKAALDGQGSIAVGNAIGSNIFNIGLILGLTAILCPIKVKWQVVKIDAPIVIVVAILGSYFLLDGNLVRWEGVLLLAGAVAYTIFNLFLAGKGATPDIEVEVAESTPAQSKNVWRDIGYVIAGLGVLVLGSRLLVDNASSLARGFGISDAIIGLTIVSAGTSMPELATSVLAALRKQPDLAIGNIVGSNIFNILGILGAAAVFSPLKEIGLARIDYLAMLAFSVALLPIIWSGLKIRRAEGTLLIIGYVAYLWKIWPT